ncbi:hypothetical protein [Tepidiforma sp.]|uniref:hypothetical protein n=1 Tax=Tepidiforma sp. TaxID=2682230 RepID=UPI002ADD4D02|nr:hypothetical protein [Tepidiforma sp.]
MERCETERFRVVYLVRQAPGWLLAEKGSERPVGWFSDLGEALDAATAGGGLVRVVILSREAKDEASEAA